MNFNNFILKTDSYKLSHHLQYVDDLTYLYSYMESRGGMYPATVFYGLQYYLKEYFEDVKITKEDVDEARYVALMHFAGRDIFNYSGWMYIVEKLEGKLPIKIKAVKEGTLVPTGNVLMTIENTDPNCAWLVNPLETLLMKLWAPITIATNSFYCKKAIAERLLKTGSDLLGLEFKLHDFGYRGVSSEETAGILGSAHLTQFVGTDTFKAILTANQYYNDVKCVGDFKMYGFSVPASEHSVACTWGKDKEKEYFKNMLNKYPTGIVSIVSDTYDVYKFVENMGNEFRDEIMQRNGTVVFRPDSGDPIEVNLQLINTLWNIFGGTYQKGTDGRIYKLLIPQVRLLQGDGIDPKSLIILMDELIKNGWAIDNWIFGSGGGLLQKFDRDTQKFAIKASYGEIAGEGMNLQKDPITSKGKRSKAGIMKLHKADNVFMTICKDSNNVNMFKHYTDELKTVFDGNVIESRFQEFGDVRNTSLNYFNKLIK